MKTTRAGLPLLVGLLALAQLMLACASTFDPTPIADYTLGRPDSVTDSRSFNVGPGTLNNLNDIQLTGANIPPGLTYTAMALTINPATGDVTAPFTISTRSTELLTSTSTRWRQYL